MKVDREVLLRALNSVRPGLAVRETVAQGSCVVFHEGKVWTFNDEIACQCKSPLNIEGAVKAEPLLKLLDNLKDEKIDVSAEDGNLLVKCKPTKGRSRKVKFRLESEILLPIEMLEEPDEWRELSDDFDEAMAIIHSCADSGSSEYQQPLSSIHISPGYIEATDRYQIGRYYLDIGVDESILVKAEAMKKAIGNGFVQVSETKSWLHLKNANGLIFSCRRDVQNYFDFDEFLKADNLDSWKLPNELEEAASMAQIITSEAVEDSVTVDLRKDKVIIKGIGPSGEYAEMKELTYDGEPIKFVILTKLLIELTKKSNECMIGDGFLLINGEKFVYSTQTDLVEGKDNAEAA